jgi:hypothetical protein
MKATLRHLATISAFIFLLDSTSLQAAPTQGLVAYYPLNGNANDMSGNARNGTATGTSPTTNKFGDPNTALFLNGITDLITLPIQQNGVLKCTYSVWFKTSAGGVLLGTSAPSNLPSLVLGVVTTGTGGAGVGQAIWVADAAHVSVGHQPVSIYNDNQWHHFVGVFDSVAGQLNPAQFRLYIDGKLVIKSHSVNPPNAPINNSAFMRIGSNQRWVATGGNFTGSIDDVRIYDKALTAEEVQEIYYLDDVDRDGILDRYETGTGIYVSPTDTGTSPSNADSDGDGIKDGTELTQYGTNPNLKAFAATHAVLPGASIQAKIDIAVAGDIVAIFGGTYNEDLTIDKAIRLVEVSGQQVTLAGNVTFNNISDAPPFEGFTFGSSGRGIVLNSTTGMIFRNLTGTSSSGITANGASSIQILNCDVTDVAIHGTTTLNLRDSSINSLHVNGTSAECSNSTLRGGINQSAGVLNTTKITVAGNFETQSAATKTVAFRTTVAGDCSWRSKKNWFGYSEARSFNFIEQNDGKVVIVGNKIDRQGGEANGIHCHVSNSSILITNNRVVRVGYNFGGDTKNGIDLRGSGNTANIANNYCQLQYYGEDYYGVRGDGIYVRDFTQATIINNVIVGAKHGISAPFEVLAQNNLYWASPWGGRLREANGVAAEGTLYTDPLFVAGEEPKLQATSPCINAGTPDPRYNDRDGSRNDIGPSGGAWYDPDGWTTENPVVISFDLSPDVVLEGVETEVILSEGQAVSAP